MKKDRQKNEPETSIKPTVACTQGGVHPVHHQYAEYHPSVGNNNNINSE